MSKLIGISGSLRRGSLNSALLRASAVFDAEGNLSDPKIEEQLRVFLQGFADFAKSSRQRNNAS